MLSGLKKLLHDVTESVSNLASNAVADATISASLALPTMQMTSDSDAWHSLGAHQRSCLQAISDNQNKNHAANAQTAALLASVCSTLQAQDSLVANLQQDIDFVAESQSSLSSLAAELAIMSQELTALTSFLASFREAHISRTVTKLKINADAELLRAQKNSHALITAASRARDLNLNKSIHASKAPVSIPPASESCAAPSQIFADVDVSGSEPQRDQLPSAEAKVSEVVSAPDSGATAGDSVIIDFEELLADEQDSTLSNASQVAAEDEREGE
jgi:hypothetical protein